MDRLARLIHLVFLVSMLAACGNVTATTVPALAVNTAPAPQTAETPSAAQPPPAGHTPAVHAVGTTAPVHGNLTALDLTATAAAQPIQPNITPPAGAVTPGATSVPRYGIFEQRFSWSSAAYTNPWEQVQLTMMLNAPSGKSTKIGGFYYAPNEWRARFSPNEIGVWAWQATITDGNKKEESKGSFTVVASNAPGFARVNPNNKFRWVLDDGSPYYPIGIGDCILSKDPAVSPLNNMGFDGGPVTESNREGQRTDFDTYLKAYSAAGVNLFRWSVDNCAFGLYKKIDPQGNVYGLQEGLWGDELVQRLRQSGLHTYMTFFGFLPPFPNGSNNPAQMDAIKRYVKYVVDRYGAYVDFWEMMNESPNPPITIDDGWYNQVGAYLHGIDPYQHPVATSWEKPNLGVIDVTAPHWYQKEDEFASDREVKSQIDQYKRFGKPVIFGEQGNSDANWDARSSLRMRLRSWTAFFDEGVLIFWNASCCKGATNGYASNIYLGPEERGYLKVLQDFTRGIDPRVVLEDITVSNPDIARAYALRSPTTYVAYVHNYKDHTNSTSGLRVTVNLLAGGTATWTSPTTGQVLGTQIVPAGTQTLTVPAFVTDIALKIR